jgi:PII-like signaling protein
VHGIPAFVAVCDLLRRCGVAGATALLGVDGTAHGRRQRARFFGRNADVPVMVIAVGSAMQIGQVLPELGGLLARPMITLERVQICKRDGELLVPPARAPAEDAHGLALWQKVVIFTSEAQLHGGRPVHREITRRLRAAGASGSTTLRGVWGFHGDHEPHGDRAFQFGRHVPVATTLVDTPERVMGWFGIVDEATAEGGLVTSETVPATRVTSGQHGRGGLRLSPP